MENLEKENKYFRVKERVEEIKKFYNSLISYIIVNSFLAILNYWLDGWNYPWFLWSAGPWAVWLLFQAAKVYRWNPIFSKDWEERKIKEFMEEDNKTNTSMHRE